MNRSNEAKMRDMRREYTTEFLIVILLLIITAFGFGFGFGVELVAKDRRIKTLETTVAHNDAEIMDLVMTSLTFTTRYMQNGTCALGFVSLSSGASASSLSDFSDYVFVNYTLKEQFLTQASVPLTVFEISATPRPIVFPGYSNIQPNSNDMALLLTLCDPPINQLDSGASEDNVIAYGYTTASKIELEPNCVAMSTGEHNNQHCTEENAYSPRFTSSYPTRNAVHFYTNNLYAPGSATIQWLWGQYSYVDFDSQYDFVGTSVSFTEPIQLLLPHF